MRKRRDCRAINTELIDAYMLKSLDAVVEGDISTMSIQRLKNGQLLLTSATVVHLSLQGRSSTGQNETLSRRRDNHPFNKPYDLIINCAGFTWNAKKLFFPKYAFQLSFFCAHFTEIF